ncbi:MAG: hypothetical protein MHM6MM_001052 [Cercozoa sp. M6MM]
MARLLAVLSVCPHFVLTSLFRQCPVGDLFLRVYLSTDEPSSHSRLLPALFPKINSAQIERLQRQPDEWVDKPLKPLWNLLGRSVFLSPSEKEFYVMWTLVELSHPVTLQGKEQRYVTDFASNYSDEVRAHVQNYRGGPGRSYWSAPRPQRTPIL